MPLKIIFLNRSFYPDITATGQLLTELCEDLVKEYGCRVTVITGRPRVTYGNPCDLPWQGLIRREDYKGVEIVRVRNTVFDTRCFAGRVINYLTYFALSIYASIKIERQDMVVTLTDPPIIPLSGLLLASRFRAPFMISVRDIFPEAAAGLEGSQNKILNFLLENITRFALRRADLVVALGKLMRNRLIEGKGVDPKRISVISDWADCQSVFPCEKDNKFSRAHNLADKFVVMYAGNIGASAGLEFVIDCAQQLKENKNIVFIFVGEGIMKKRLLELVSNRCLENVKFLPFQPKEMLADVFSSADVFLLPLKRGLAGYSLPSKIYAILASGRPYIACVDKESEVAEITREFECGALAKPQDGRDLTKEVTRFFNDRELLKKMGQKAREAALLFDRSQGVKKYHEAFLYLCKTKTAL